MLLPDLDVIKFLNIQVPEKTFENVVYFLFKNTSLIYIGSTNQIFSRLNAHIQAGRVFDSYCFIPFEDNSCIDFRDVEKAYINYLKPAENKKHYKNFDMSSVSFFNLENFGEV